MVGQLVIATLSTKKKTWLLKFLLFDFIVSKQCIYMLCKTLHLQMHCSATMNGFFIHSDLNRQLQPFMYFVG